MSCACVCTVVHACGYFNELDVCIAPINVFVVRGKVLGSSVRVRVKTRYDAVHSMCCASNKKQTRNEKVEELYACRCRSMLCSDLHIPGTVMYIQIIYIFM